MFEEIGEIIRYRELLRNLVLRDIKVRYRRSILGFLWMMLNPLLMMLVLSVVFSELFKISTKNYVVYLLSGIVMWNFFSQSTSIALGGFVNNSSLIKKVYIPKIIFPLSMLLSALVNFVFSLVPLFLVLVLTGTEMSSRMYLIPLCLALVFVFAFGLSLLLSTMTVFFRDMVHIYDVVLLAWMYATPVFYPETIIPERFRVILEINPLYYYTALFRGGLFMDVVSLPTVLSRAAVFALFSFVLGHAMYRAYRDRVIYYL